MVAYLPQLYLPIETLARARAIEYGKLNKGLGLTAMSVADVGEDAASMAANAVLRLIEQNELHPNQIGRIYVGTESAVDGSKPLGSYVVGMLQTYFEEQYGKDCLLNCDVVDMTFACIGSVDAMQNTLDWVRGGDDRIGIVVGSDNAKYELSSTGEYTQGAGAVALLLRRAPRLLAFSGEWGVATRDVHDFYKPLRRSTRAQLLRSFLPEGAISQLNGAMTELEQNKEYLYLHRETPVFDGPYSNDCYQERIGEALRHYACRNQCDGAIASHWSQLVFHLPYAYQARRMFPAIFLQEAKLDWRWAAIAEVEELQEPQENDYADTDSYQTAYNKFLKALSKSEAYRSFVQDKIAAGERASSLVGNLYTSSIFLSLMSTLETALEQNRELRGAELGFFAYGSGSKSKVFTAEVQDNWQAVVQQFQLLSFLQQRTEIHYDTYEALHRGLQSRPLSNSPQTVFRLQRIDDTPGNREGARTYGAQSHSEAKRTAQQQI